MPCGAVFSVFRLMAAVFSEFRLLAAVFSVFRLKLAGSYKGRLGHTGVSTHCHCLNFFLPTGW